MYIFKYIDKSRMSRLDFQALINRGIGEFSPEPLELSGVNDPHGKRMLFEAIRDRYEWTGLGDGFYETFISENLPKILWG